MAAEGDGQRVIGDQVVCLVPRVLGVAEADPAVLGDVRVDSGCAVRAHAWFLPCDLGGCGAVQAGVVLALVSWAACGWCGFAAAGEGAASAGALGHGVSGSVAGLVLFDTYRRLQFPVGVRVLVAERAQEREVAVGDGVQLVLHGGF